MEGNPWASEETTNRRRIFASHTSAKGLRVRLYKELQELNSKRPANLIKD